MDQITVKEAALKLHLTGRRVRQLIKAGKLKAVKPGRDWMIDPASVEEYLEQRGRQTTKSRAW